MKYKVKTGAVVLRSTEMEYAVFGEGKKNFVMLPGISLHSVILSAGAVAAAYEEFGGEYTVYVFERLTDIPAGHTVADMAEDTAAAMQKLGIADAYVFGASQGGMTAQILAARYPQLVKKVILGSTMLKEDAFAEENFTALAEAAAAGDIAALNRAFFSMVYAEDYRKKYETAFGILEKQGTKEEAARFLREIEAMRGFDATAEKNKIACPVLVIGDASDRVLSPSAFPALAAYHNAELYMYDGFGHAVYDMAPDYKKRIMDFFHDPVGER